MPLNRRLKNGSHLLIPYFSEEKKHIINETKHTMWKQTKLYLSYDTNALLYMKINQIVYTFERYYFDILKYEQCVVSPY